VGAPVTRIVSDVHFGDRVSRVRSLAQMRPLLDGADALVLNGDTLDTRTSRHPDETEAQRREVLEFFASSGMPVTFLTGNHDPDISSVHELGLAQGRVLVTHGDILFDNIVPWSQDAGMIGGKIAAALACAPANGALGLEGRLEVFRSVSASIPQRHQSETNPLRYVLRLASDTVWPPGRIFKMLRAWREAPGRAAALAGKDRPKAKFVMIGHTHKPGVWKTPSGVVVINTGSFCRPFGGMAAEVDSGAVRIREITFRRGEFHIGGKVAEFPLS
jgi:UDP-2,3-diacylglucosamine pyrophosphatase LpxH